MSSEEKYTLGEFIVLAMKLIKRHGLIFWNLQFDNAKRRLGYCNLSSQTLSFSRIAIVSCTKDLAEKVILHEIAHALVGKGHGHDAVWRRKCIEIGGDGKRLADSNEIDKSNMNYTYKGTCPNGHEHFKSRLPRKEQSCGKCFPGFNKDFLIVWERQR